MIKLNDKSLVVGQIKQLLKNFNLPNCLIGADNRQLNKFYIADDNIYLTQEINDSLDPKITKVSEYVLGKKYTNLTSNLIISNNYYDRYTHRYLGKYLRFIRDYKNIDFMSMYNCFDAELYTGNLKLTNSISFDPDDNENFYIYSVPVSKKELTIYSMNHSTIEMCLTLSNVDQTNEYLIQIAELTYKRIKSIKPFLYDKFYMWDSLDYFLEAIVGNSSENKDVEYKSKYGKANFPVNDYLPEDSPNYVKPSQLDYTTIEPEAAEELYKEMRELIFKNYDNLRILMKIPKSDLNSIIVLEGDYTHPVKSTDKYLLYKYENTLYDSGYHINPQLLSFENRSKNYLLADRLIEYLSENAITPLNPDYEISRMQKNLIKTHYVNSDYLGLWSDEDSYALKTIIIENKLNKDNFDILPYYGKEVESLFIKVENGELEDVI